MEVIIALLDQVLLNKFKVIIIISLLDDPWFGRRNSGQPSCLGMKTKMIRVGRFLLLLQDSKKL